MTTTTTAGRVQRAIRTTIAPGATLHTPARRAPFVVDAVDGRGVVLLLGEGEWQTLIPWECLEGIAGLLRDREWVRIGGTYSVDGEPGTLDGHCKQYVNRATAAWVASVLEKAGVVDVDTSLPAKVRLRPEFTA